MIEITLILHAAKKTLFPTISSFEELPPQWTKDLNQTKDYFPR